MDTKLKILIGLAVAALLVVTLLPMIDTDQTENFGGEAGDYEESSALDGVMSAWAQLVDNVGNIIWGSADPGSGFPQTVIEPVSGKEAANFKIGARYQASGSNIDWSSMSVEAEWVAFKYRSPTGEKLLSNKWSTKLLTGQQNGDLESLPIAIEPLVPATVTNIWWELAEDGVTKVPYSEVYDQKTTESHPFELTFQGNYYVDVDDMYGNHYEDYLLQEVTLQLQWVGSDFSVEWSDIVDEQPDTPASVLPEITHLADCVALQGDVLTFTWSATDANQDISSYTISLDGLVQTTNTAYTGGPLTWTYKFTSLGEHVVKVVVTDSVGNTGEDEVTVMVVSGVEPLIPPEGDPIPVDPMDPTTWTNGIQTFDNLLPTGTPALSLFGGTGNTQVLVLLALGIVFVWILTMKRKR